MIEVCTVCFEPAIVDSEDNPVLPLIDGKHAVCEPEDN